MKSIIHLTTSNISCCCQRRKTTATTATTTNNNDNDNKLYESLPKPFAEQAMEGGFRRSFI